MRGFTGRRAGVFFRGALRSGRGCADKCPRIPEGNGPPQSEVSASSESTTTLSFLSRVFYWREIYLRQRSSPSPIAQDGEVPICQEIEHDN